MKLGVRTDVTKKLGDCLQMIENCITFFSILFLEKILSYDLKCKFYIITSLQPPHASNALASTATVL